jgi:hypothetical protein
MTVRSNSSQRKMDRAKNSFCVAFEMMPYIEHVQAALRTATPSGDDMHVSVPFEAPVSRFFLLRNNKFLSLCSFLGKGVRHTLEEIEKKAINSRWCIEGEIKGAYDNTFSVERFLPRPSSQISRDRGL